MTTKLGTRTDTNDTTCKVKGCPTRGACPWHRCDDAPDPNVLALMRHTRYGSLHTHTGPSRHVRAELRKLVRAAGLWDPDDAAQVEHGRRIGLALGSTALREHLAGV